MLVFDGRFDIPLHNALQQNRLEICHNQAN